MCPLRESASFVVDSSRSRKSVFYPVYIVFIPTKAFYAHAESLASSFLLNKKPGFCGNTLGTGSHTPGLCVAFRLAKSMSARFPGRSTLAEDSISVAELFRPGFNGFPAYFADVMSSGMRIE
jgi:hypothetical protein